MDHLRWVDSRREEREEVEVPPPPKNRKHTQLVPTYRTEEELFALDVDPGVIDEPVQRVTLSKREIEEEATRLLRDPKAFQAWLNGEG